MRLLKQLSNVKKNIFREGGGYKKNLNWVGGGTTPKRGGPWEKLKVGATSKGVEGFKRGTWNLQRNYEMKYN